MASHIPKENPARRNKHTETILYRRNKSLIGPNLPRDYMWCHRTREWWDMWRSHEIAPKLEPSDWEALLDLAVIHNEFWTGTLPPAQKVAYWAALKRGISSFGGTVEDRLKLRIKFAPEPEEEAKTSEKPKAVDYSDLLEDDEEGIEDSHEAGGLNDS